MIWDTCLILSGKTKTVSQWLKFYLTMKKKFGSINCFREEYFTLSTTAKSSIINVNN